MSVNETKSVIYYADGQMVCDKCQAGILCADGDYAYCSGEGHAAICEKCYLAGLGESWQAPLVFTKQPNGSVWLGKMTTSHGSASRETLL